MVTLLRIDKGLHARSCVVSMQDLVWYPSKMPSIIRRIRLEDYGGNLPRISWVNPDNYTQDLPNPAINFYLG